MTDQIARLQDPETIRLHMGELTASEMRVAQAAIRYALAGARVDGAGWRAMTEEARRIQMRHLDKHDGDVYHAMQSLCVRFGSRREGPMIENTQPPKENGDE